MEQEGRNEGSERNKELREEDPNIGRKYPDKERQKNPKHKTEKKQEYERTELIMNCRNFYQYLLKTS